MCVCVCARSTCQPNLHCSGRWEGRRKAADAANNTETKTWRGDGRSETESGTKENRENGRRSHPARALEMKRGCHLSSARTCVSSNTTERVFERALKETSTAIRLHGEGAEVTTWIYKTSSCDEEGLLFLSGASANKPKHFIDRYSLFKCFLLNNFLSVM